MKITANTPSTTRCKPSDLRDVQRLYAAGIGPGVDGATLLGSIVATGAALGKCYKDEVTALAPLLLAQPRPFLAADCVERPTPSLA